MIFICKVLFLVQIFVKFFKELMILLRHFYQLSLLSTHKRKNLSWFKKLKYIIKTTKMIKSNSITNKVYVCLQNLFIFY